MATTGSRGWLGLLPALLLATVVIGAPAAATADDCHDPCHRGGPRGHRAYRDRHCGCDGYGYGGGHVYPIKRVARVGDRWTVIRRFLVRDHHGVHSHPANWFLRRWPCASADTLRLGEHACCGLEGEIDACALAQAAFADLGEGPVALDDRMLRGLERMHRGATEEAASEFDAVLDAEPTHERARYGRVLCAIVGKDWARAAGTLRRLAADGLLRADDRLAIDGTWEDPKPFTSIVGALVDYTRYSGSADSRLVLGWALHAQGEADRARPYLEAALREAGGTDAAARVLLARAEPEAVRPEPKAVPEAGADTPATPEPEPVQAAPKGAAGDGERGTQDRTLVAARD